MHDLRQVEAQRRLRLGKRLDLAPGRAAQVGHDDREPGTLARHTGDALRVGPPEAADVGPAVEDDGGPRFLQRVVRTRETRVVGVGADGDRMQLQAARTVVAEHLREVGVDLGGGHHRGVGGEEGQELRMLRAEVAEPPVVRDEVVAEGGVRGDGGPVVRSAGRVRKLRQLEAAEDGRVVESLGLERRERVRDGAGEAGEGHVRLLPVLDDRVGSQVVQSLRRVGVEVQVRVNPHRRPPVPDARSRRP
ncbi:hypothetical protein [Microbacterium sp. SCN 71-17]|uniref:hypothetical protein n=1 Tax=Microbacterium sp. SCN 71-17 TaxID=1660111 RepID=UPI0025DD6AC5|nr:hypothetical protein [Microbacterium sp. SCN 71-17]